MKKSLEKWNRMNVLEENRQTKIVPKDPNTFTISAVNFVRESRATKTVRLTTENRNQTSEFRWGGGGGGGGRRRARWVKQCAVGGYWGADMYVGGGGLERGRELRKRVNYKNRPSYHHMSQSRLYTGPRP